MQYVDDTIAAIATAYGASGIGIIRISGAQALAIIQKIFRPYQAEVKIEEMRSYTAHYGSIIDDEQNVIDECIILYMKGPHSYTGEDTVEIDVHGGTLVCNKILQRVCESGARMAQPGEFTKRAFLNGRMDLSQAEAVMDVIHADNEKALAISVNQLKGGLKDIIVKMRKAIIHENAFIEYALDDPEHVSLEGYKQKLGEIVDSLVKELQKMIVQAEEGKIIKEGVKTVIIGKPNAGKSSLLNALLGEERAIVTEVPGTTRDTLEERAIVAGIPLNIVDTAGIRETQDVVEKIGVEKAKQVIKDADLILYVIDQSVPLTEEDYKIIEIIKDHKVIVLLNKSDIAVQAMDLSVIQNLNVPMLSVSMKRKEGLEEFQNTLKEMFLNGEVDTNQQVMITSERHKEAMSKAVASLLRVKESIENDMPEDFYTIDLLDAYEQLGYIIGESVHDDLVNQIFADFCTGK